jgi:hypothetical protein
MYFVEPVGHVQIQVDLLVGARHNLPPTASRTTGLHCSSSACAHVVQQLRFMVLLHWAHHQDVVKSKVHHDPA